MAKELALTDREKRVLRWVVHHQATDPISRYLQRPIKGSLVGTLVAATVVVVALSAIFGLRLALDRYGLVISTGVLVVHGVVAICWQIPVRERLIRKLYRTLEESAAGVNSLTREEERPTQGLQRTETA